MENKTFTLEQNFQAALRAGTPIIAINCFDPEATIQQLQKYLDGKGRPIIQWDIIRGWKGRNVEGRNAAAAALAASNNKPVEATQNVVENLETAMNLPEKTLLFMLNSHHHINDKPKPDVVQALWNLRDTFKTNKRSVILLAPTIQLPTELQQDIVVLNEQLPTDTQLLEIVKTLCTKAKVTNGTDEVFIDAIDALRGVSAFPAEQATSMSIKVNEDKTRELDIAMLWERKRQLINSTPGLSVWMGGQKFNDIGGLEELKKRFTGIINGKKAPKVVVWIDEIEKAMAGSGGEGDSSGTSQDQLGVLLTEMQDKEYSGSLFVGVPGAAKSAAAKAIANEANILTIKLDLGALKGQFVGLSEERIRHAMRVIEAVGGIGGAFFIATSNDIRIVRPELKRRFKKGIWFFDLPTKVERKKIWEIFLPKYEFDIKEAKNIDFDEHWTGAEIEVCCQTAWEEGMSLKEAALGIIPVAVSDRFGVERLRGEANGKYNSVQCSGAYTISDVSLESEFINDKAKGRATSFDD